MNANRFTMALITSLWFASLICRGDAPCRVYVIGDSTAAAYPEERRPLAGWAEELQEHFDPARVIVEDKARSGRSSKSFLEEGAWAPIRDALKPGDFVFIQFGHNDSKKEDPKRFTEPDTTYKQFLTTYVNDTRAKGSVPVLLTSINRYRWDENDKLVDTMGAYPDAARALAKELDVPLIDLHQRTRKLYESLGPQGTRSLFLFLAKGESPNYPDGKEDGTHLREEGARAVSKLVVEAIQDLKLPLANAIKK
ncbi:MAG: rhamnogalacturonan acetylesterase [Candidatus Hydrogenedentes bacterium]|nr:rhamnogalacturonan acetylesterase [Candidatus Hydrogenedentota bacterium]